MSKPLTRAQLVLALEQAHVSYQKLEAECAQLRENVVAKRNVRPAWRAAPSEASVIAHDSYASALVKARELAMRTGRSVRVG